MNKKCNFYPCHFEGQDCSFCYCPLYPCNDTRTGGKLHKGVWDCSKCTFLHDKITSRIIKNFILYYKEIKYGKR